MKPIALCFGIILFALLSCNKGSTIFEEEVIDTTLPEFRFPLTVGNSWTYFGQGTFLDNDRITYNYKTTINWEITNASEVKDIQYFTRKITYSRWSWRYDAPEHFGRSETGQTSDSILKNRKFIIIGQDSILRYSAKYLGNEQDTLTIKKGYAGRYSSVNYHTYVNTVGKIYWSADATLAGAGEFNLIAYKLKN